jgi:hypothetical protein
MWNKKWQGERDEREAREREDARIVEECFTWQQVMDWMMGHDTFHKPVEQFEHVKTIKGVAYWRKREKVVRLLTPREAYAEYESYGFEQQGHEFIKLYEPVCVIGHDGTLFKRLWSIKKDAETAQREGDA